MNTSTFLEGGRPALHRAHKGATALVLAMWTSVAASGDSRLLFVGQDLDSIRGYVASGCCRAPDGLTAYLSLYNLRSGVDGFGGLGLDERGEPVDLEHSWGAGPVNAYRTATAFGAKHLAVGLDFTEAARAGGIDAILAGAYDAEIDHLGRLFAHVPGDVFLRIGYEFDGAWNAGYEDAGRYARTFRYIVDRLRAEPRAANVQFVWQASASPLDDILDGGHDDIRAWYPGDDYVDWLAFSWFLHPDEAPTTGARPPTARQLAQEMLTLAEASGKPVMVAEAMPQGYDLARLTRRFTGPLWDGAAGTGERQLTAEEIWQAWYAPLFHFLHEHRGTIQALAYINCHWDAQPMWGPPYQAGYWGDSRLEKNPELARRFSQAVADWKAGN